MIAQFPGLVDALEEKLGGGIKLVLWAQISLLCEMMQSCKCLPHVSKMSTPRI